MRITAIILCVLFSVWPCQAQIVLSEIMFNPEGNERYDEYVELYNTSKTETVDLSGWLVSDSSKFNIILPYGQNALLRPQQYALILVPNYFDKSRIYDGRIPDSTLLLTIADAQLGAYGLKNSAGEKVSLHRPDSSQVAAYTYTPDNDDGISEEKVDLYAGDTLSNWQNSTVVGGTPGYKNSVTPSPIDIALSSIEMSPVHPSDADSIQLKFTIKNVGKESISEFSVQVELAGAGQLVDQKERRALAPGDSSIICCQLAPFPRGEFDLQARISCKGDDNDLNNQQAISFSVVTRYAAGSVVINEIMYDTDEKADEWIELYNASSETVLLQGWGFSDSRKRVVISDSAIVLPAGDYCLLTNSELKSAASALQLVLTLPELNNSGDALGLYDAANTLIDTVSYSSQMGGSRNISLERIRAERASDPSNWGTCTDSVGATPGRRNSVSPKARDAAIDGSGLMLSPPRPVEGDAVSIKGEVLNAGMEPLNEIKVTLSYTEPGSNSFQFIGSETVSLLEPDQSQLWNILWPQPPAGTWTLLSEVWTEGDLLPANNSRMDTVSISYASPPLVFNEIMYSPLQGESEWIELMNRTDLPVNVLGWMLSKADTLQSLKIIDTSMPIAGHAFFVLTRDSSSQSPGVPYFILPNLSSLRNDQDTLFLFDRNKRVMDHVIYNSDWGGAKGRSLEKINPATPSSEASNWTTCVDEKGHTAGRENSVLIDLMPKSVTLSGEPNPFSPDGDGRDDFAGISYTIPATSAIVNVTIYDIQGRLVRHLLNNEPSAGQRTVFWDGLNDEGRRCRMGIYIIHLQAVNERDMQLYQARTTVVLAGAL